MASKPKLQSLLRHRVAAQMEEQDPELYSAIRDSVQTGHTPREVYRMVLDASGDWRTATMARTVAERVTEVPA